MSTAFRAIISLVAGTVVGVLAVLGLCSIPALTFSTACGHNVGMWLFATVPLGILACWLTLTALARPAVAGMAPPLIQSYAAAPATAR